MKNGTPRHQAQDFGHWLMACRWEEKQAEGLDSRAYTQRIVQGPRSFEVILVWRLDGLGLG